MIGVLEAEKIMILESQVKHYESTVDLMRKTLRDEFAIAALPPLVSDYFQLEEFDEDHKGACNFVAGIAYDIADAMLEARNAKP